MKEKPIIDRSHLPELFRLIIKMDRDKEQIFAVTRDSCTVVPLSVYRKWKARRLELSRAAEKFIQRQRGGNVS